MRLVKLLSMTLIIAVSSTVLAKEADHQWSNGKVLDESRARYFAGMLHNSSSESTQNGSWDGNANSTSYGNTTNTQANGSYSGTTSTSTSGMSVPVYRVFDNLVIEGENTVFITSERLRWRWSKGAHVAVNSEIKYYVDGRKLHVLDEDNKEHTIQIIKEIRKVPQSGSPAPPQPVATPVSQTNVSRPSDASVSIESTPPGADIEVDGGFVGNTPSTVTVTPGAHEIAVKKKGFAAWTRKLNVTGGTVHLSAELEPSTGK